MRILSVSFLTVILILGIIPVFNTVDATITSSEFEESYYHYTSLSIDKYFTFKVKVIILTEADDTWKPNTLYFVDFIITLTYFNESFAAGSYSTDPPDNNVFQLLFFSPSLDFIPFTPSNYRVHINETSLHYPFVRTLGRLTVLQADSWGTTRVLNARPSIDWAIAFTNGTLWSYDRRGRAVNHWVSPEPLWVSVEREGDIDPLVFFFVGIAVAAIPLGTYILYESRKQKGKRQLASIGG
jgi:hypothetical protein